jgi:hypothetical protein
MSEQDDSGFDDVTVEDLTDVSGGFSLPSKCTGTVGSAGSISTPVSSIGSVGTYGSR